MNESLNFLKNFTFFTLFASMLSFWVEFIFLSTHQSQPQIISDVEENFTPKKVISFGESFFFISLLFLTLELITRWFLSKHFPLSNLYESLLFLNWSLLTFFFFFEKFLKSQFLLKMEVEENQSALRDSENFFGAILSSFLLFLQSFADWQLPDEMRIVRPLVPALQSNWLLMHVSIMIFSYATLFIGSLFSIVYLVLDTFKENDSKNEFLLKLNTTKAVLSGPNTLENVLKDLDTKSSQILSLGFPLLTLGILSGAIWANEAWGSYWSWDPKETWAFITWLVFAFYLHTRIQKGWKGKDSALVATLGFFIIWICYLGVNLLAKGLHSYGWIVNGS
jgi:hypothetical protein